MLNQNASDGPSEIFSQFFTHMDRTRHIMIADDDEDDIELLRTAIKECMAKVNLSVAKNGRALLMLLQQQPLPDLIVLDLNMPYMNGYECLGHIRRDERYKHVPILILSTSVLKSDIDYCLARGANHYVVKPSNSKDLENLIKVLCSGIMVNPKEGQV